MRVGLRSDTAGAGPFAVLHETGGSARAPRESIRWTHADCQAERRISRIWHAPRRYLPALAPFRGAAIQKVKQDKPTQIPQSTKAGT